MAGYIPWHGKKRERLAEREEAFAALLQNGADRAELAKAAEAIRAAQVAALRSRRSEFPPAERNAVTCAHLDGEIKFWLDLTIAQIIKGYQTGKLKGLRSAAVKQGRRPADSNP